MSEKRNVIWILVDAIRNYHSTGDELARLPVMDRLAQEGVYFSQAVTSATSTSMSISSQMVGIPACYLSRNFDDFKYETENFTTLSTILKRNGFNNYGISFAVDLRYWFHGIIDHVPRKQWPKGYPRAMPWDNDGVIKLFDKVISNGLEEPFFLFVHINGRRDYGVNDRVEYMLSRLDAYVRDSIVIMNSDHGMPDRSKEEFYKATTSLGLFYNRHDLMMTDDNILIPLIVKYPGCGKKNIETAVGTIDIVPTVLDLLDIPVDPELGIVGKSLVPLIRGRDVEVYRGRKIRTDTRYIAQKDRITSIRDSSYKYVFYRDVPLKEKELFFDLSKDKNESNNLIKSRDPGYRELVRQFREEYEKQEADQLDFQGRYLLKKLKKNLKSLTVNPDSIREVVVFGRGDYSFNVILFNILKQCFDRAGLTYLIDIENSDSDFAEQDDSPFVLYTKIDEKRFQRKIDLCLILVTGRRSSDYLEIVNLTRLLKPAHRFFVDYNLDFTTSFRLKNLRYLIQGAMRKKELYLARPRQILTDLKRVVQGKVGSDPMAAEGKEELENLKL
jgi:N-sulphoglucosamine sulphohydrolase, C-terminal/Sulfatase